MLSFRRKKKTIGYYPVRYVVTVLTLTLTILGAFSLMLLHTHTFKKNMQENIEIQVYLSKDITPQEIISLQHTLSQKKFLLKKKYVHLKWISKTTAAHNLIQNTGEDFLNLLQENPLQDMFVCKIDPHYQNFSSIQQSLLQIPGIAAVETLADLVQKVHQNLKKINFILMIIACILLVMILILMHSTIKIAMYSQRFLIRTMQLVGAKTSFICKPFLIRALFIGFWSGLLANLILITGLQYSYDYIPYSMQVHCPWAIATILGSVFLLGVFINGISTLIITRQYIHVPLSKLY